MEKWSASNIISSNTNLLNWKPFISLLHTVWFIHNLQMFKFFQFQNLFLEMKNKGYAPKRLNLTFLSVLELYKFVASSVLAFSSFSSPISSIFPSSTQFAFFVLHASVRLFSSHSHDLVIQGMKSRPRAVTVMHI